MRRRWGAMLLLMVGIPVWGAEVGVDVSAGLGTRVKNEDYVFKTGEEWRDVASELEVVLTSRGSVFGGGSFGFELSYQGDLSIQQSDPSSVEVGEAYATVSPMDFVFFTLGRIRREFGVAYFTNVSNRISPALRTAKGVVRNAVPLAALDVVVLQGLSFGTLLWFPEELRWEKASWAVSAHGAWGGWEVHLYGYLEESEWPSVGVDLSYGSDWWLVYGEGVWKERSDRVYMSGDEVVRKEGGFLAGAVGVSVFSGDLAFGVEGWGSEEGYERDEQESVYERMRRVQDGTPSSPTEAVFVESLVYRPLEWGRYYAGAWISCHRPFEVSDLSLSGYGVVSFDGWGGYVGVRASYWLDELSTMWLECVWYGGEEDSEFATMVPERFHMIIGISISG